MTTTSTVTLRTPDLEGGALVTDARPTVRRLAQLLDTSESVLVLTGAGCSADSGLPVFTGPDGLYADPRLAALSHADQLPGSLPELWHFWGPMRATIAAAQPHAGHQALARWIAERTRRGLPTTLATQNVDDLHERSGVPEVHHLHGRLDRTRCLTCAFTGVDDWQVPATTPSCPRCGGQLRPGMVMFGEPLDLDASHATRRAVRDCVLLLSVGTSSVVSTSTGIVRYARDVGALRVCVDPAESVDPLYEVHLQGPASEVLPALLGR